MTAWWKHVFGLWLPAVVAVALMVLAPEQNAPDWMIAISAICAVIAIGYLYIIFDRWMTASQNHTKVAAFIFVAGSLALLSGIICSSPALVALGGLLNVAIGIFLTGAFGRWADRLRQRRG